MMRVLVTGAQGFVGRHVVAQLLSGDDTASVLGIGRSHESAACALTDARYRYRSVDLTSLDDVLSAIDDIRPTAIIHLAARLRDDDPSSLIRTNVEGTLTLLRGVAAAALPANVVLGSSAAVYGADASPPTHEDAPFAPTNLYGASKAAMESTARIVAREHGIRLVAARMFNLVGPGLDERHACSRFAIQLARLATDASCPRTIVTGDLRPTRDFVDVRDVATALVLLARADPSEDAYNIATGTETTIEDVLCRLVRIAGIEPPQRIIGYVRAADVRRSGADTGRLRTLGWRPGHTLDGSLSDLYAYALRAQKRARSAAS